MRNDKKSIKDTDTCIYMYVYLRCSLLQEKEVLIKYTIMIKSVIFILRWFETVSNKREGNTCQNRKKVYRIYGCRR